MVNPEHPSFHHPINSPRLSQPEELPSLSEIERRLEIVDEIENVIERAAKRELLLELLDILEEEGE